VIDWSRFNARFTGRPMKCWLALAQLTQGVVKRDMKSGVRAFTLFHAMVRLPHLTNAIYFKAVHAFLIAQNALIHRKRAEISRKKIL
jgi:hypothetical protein